MEDNGLIPDSHHGSRKHHSTVTCKASIDNAIANSLEDSKVALAITTDLTAAMDVVEHKLLLKKMKCLGVKDDAIALMNSFLSKRSFRVDIQGFLTDLHMQPPCSVIQGSRFSGFLMTVSTVEIPVLPKIMNDKNAVERITGEPYDIIENI